jgi:hypothetical protein
MKKREVKKIPIWKDTYEELEIKWRQISKVAGEDELDYMIDFIDCVIGLGVGLFENEDFMRGFVGKIAQESNDNGVNARLELYLKTLPHTRGNN